MANRNFGGRRMAKHWHVIAGLSQAFTVDSTKIGGSLSLDGPWTVLRCLVEYIITPTSAPAALDDVTIAVALGVVSSDAVAVGPTAMPDPVAEPDYPWLYWASHEFFFAGTDPESASAGASIRRVVDSRSMRKMKPRESLVWVAEYANTVGNPPIHLGIGQTRVLVGD